MDQFRQVALVLERVLESVVENLQLRFRIETEVSRVRVRIQCNWFLVFNHVIDDIQVVNQIQNQSLKFYRLKFRNRR